MLSKENLEKINLDGLYKNESQKARTIPSSMGLYHCKNYTYYPMISQGKLYMLDSYFNDWDSHIEVTDKNFNEWEFIFDKTKVRRISYDESLEYKEEDLYIKIATDSGGYSCSSCIWVNKDTKKDIDKQIEKAEYELKSAKNHLDYCERNLENLIKNEKFRRK